MKILATSTALLLATTIANAIPVAPVSVPETSTSVMGFIAVVAVGILVLIQRKRNKQ